MKGIWSPADIEIVERASERFRAAYRTEDKFEWTIVGEPIGDSTYCKFESSKSPELGGHLVEFGSLVSTLVDADTLVVQFHDSSDESSTRFRLKRQWHSNRGREMHR